MHNIKSIWENSLHYLASWCLHLELLGAWRTGIFPLHALLFRLRITMVYPSLIARYIALKFQFNCMSFKYLLDASQQHSFIYWSSMRGTKCCAQTFVINKSQCKIILMEPVLMPTVSAISWTLTRRQQHNSFLRRQLSGGCPDRGLSSRLLLPQRNLAAQYLTVAYDGTYSP